MIGFLRTSSPEIKMTLNGTGGNAWITQYPVSATTFGYTIGGGFKFDVGEQVCILTNLDYLTCKPEFVDVTISSSSGNSSQPSTFSQRIETINLSIGIGLRL